MSVSLTCLTGLTGQTEGSIVWQGVGGVLVERNGVFVEKICWQVGREVILHSKTVSNTRESMRTIKYLSTVVVAAVGISLQAGAKSWTLNECIDYAIANNITLKKNVLQQRSALEDVKQAQSALMPSLSASTSQNIGYTPWPEEGQYVVSGDRVETRSDRASYNGSYGFNANWTVWNGNQNRNQVKLNKITVEQAELDSATTANQLKEQIARVSSLMY